MGCLTSVGAQRQTTMNTQQTQPIETKIDTIKVAIDMHLKSYRVVRQLDYSAPQPAQRFEAAKFYPWLAQQIAQRAGSWFATKRAALATSRRGACKRSARRCW